jgi:hypothetical protein
VRPRARVEHRTVGNVVESVQAFDVLGLAVGLKDAHGEPELSSEAPNLLLELGEGEIAVVLAGATTEHVEVDAVENLDAIVGPGPQ